MNIGILFLSLTITVVTVESKPVEGSRDFEANNEIDYERVEKGFGRERARSREEELKNEPDVSTKASAKSDVNREGSSVDGVNQQQYNPLASLLVPLLQRVQFSPQTFFQDKLHQLRNSLVNLGIVVPGSNATTSKQFATTNGLLNLIGLNDSGFYTDRLEPVGFLGGNGWFANKGGLLGGPGAIYSTGSLLTDYPTPYKK